MNTVWGYQIWKRITVGLLTLTCSCSLLAWNNDPQNTLSPDLNSTQKDLIDRLQTDYHQHNERNAFIQQLTAKGQVTDELFDNLLLQWQYLNRHYATTRLLPIFATDSNKHGLFVKDLQMRIMGALYSILNPGNGADLANYQAPSDSSRLSVRLNDERVNNLVARLTEMPETMGHSLYRYECFFTRLPASSDHTGVLVRHIELVPAFWSAITHTLNSYQLLTPEHIYKLIPVAQQMLISHGAATDGIIYFQQVTLPDLFGLPEQQATVVLRTLRERDSYQAAESRLKGKIDTIWKTDLHRFDDYDYISGFRNPIMAAAMSPWVAGTALQYMQEFLIASSPLTNDASIGAEPLSYKPNAHANVHALNAYVQSQMARNLMDTMLSL